LSPALPLIDRPRERLAPPGRGVLRGLSISSVVVVALAGLACSGCRSAAQAAETRRRPFAAELSGGEADPGDYWQARFGTYLEREAPDGTGEARRYRETPPDERFSAYGLRLLESCLREDQIAPHREEQIPDEDYETFCNAPTYDDALHYLRWTLGVKPPR
jgi:hypothetical protein